MNHKIFIVGLLVVVFSTACMAYRPAVIGGIRNGTALGLVIEGDRSDPAIRFGIEASTSNSPLVFVGGKWFLSDVNSRYPMYMSAGLVGYLGSRSEVGPYISLIFDRFLNSIPLFLEIGIDVVNSSRIQVQMGYYF
ncbi:MAG: hypothetical protein A2Y40_00235 [Candidatus Margulisbacteria bacterium GWF2_35_9]|nr:MAG: hypothetical protein A2Y40_00235 [Candidatus Margulisbacteria bacterium GWF2_35_9]